MKPFLKWAGNKYRIIDQIKAVLPPGKRLIEPFAGSAAVFLNTDYDEYILAEKNLDLINIYQRIQREGKSFVYYCKKFFVPEFNCAEEFYRLRNLFNSSIPTQRIRAAIFLYLNKHGYNGLCRYNNSGIFNVPFGKQPGYFPKAEMLTFHCKSQQAKFLHEDFLVTMRQAKPGDVVYCDPPYVPLSKTANFTQYHKNGFTEQQHLMLVQEAKALAKRGIPVIISNHNTPFVLEHYRAAELKTFLVARSISRNSMTRERAPEVLAIFS